MMIDLQPNSGQGRALSERRAWVTAGLLLALHGVLCWLSRDLGILLMRDDARYLILATSLGQGGYHDLFLVGGTAHSLYPPVLPALLLTWGTVIRDSFDSYVVMNILMSVSALTLVFAAVKRIWGPVIALACLVPLCVNPLLVARVGGLRAETAYMFFTLVGVWALSRARPATQTLVVAGVAGLLAALTRTVGVTLLAAIAVLWILQRRYRAAAILATVSLATVGAWIAWTVVAPQQHAGSNYIGDLVSAAVGERPDWLAILWRRTGIRLGRYFGQTLPWSLAVPTIPGTPVDNLVASLGVAVGLLSGLLVLLKRWRIAGLYLALYAGALMAYPFMRARFLEPVIPLLIVALILGAAALVARYRPAWATPTILVLALVLTASGAARTAPRISERMACGPFDMERPPRCLSPQERSFLRAVYYIERNTNPDDVFMTKMPETLYYYSGRRSLDAEVALTTRPDAFLDYLLDKGADWVLLTAGSRKLGSYLWLHCTDLEVEESFHRRTVLFRLPDRNAAGVESRDRETYEACIAIDEFLEDYPRDAEGMAIE